MGVELFRFRVKAHLFMLSDTNMQQKTGKETDKIIKKTKKNTEKKGRHKPRASWKRPSSFGRGHSFA